MPSRLRRNVLIGLATGVASLVVAELVRPRRGTARLIDWDGVRALAASTCEEPPEPAGGWAGQEAEYDRLAAELLPQLVEFTQSPLPEGREAHFRVVSRSEWIDLNLESVRRLLRPLENLESRMPASLLSELGRSGTTQYLGRLMGFLARRVMGQYDPQLLGREPLAAGDLYIVGPNIDGWRAKADLPERPLRQWLALHELTHAVEFEAHPWLRDHIEQQLSQLLARLPSGPLNPKAVVTAALGTRSQLRAIANLQATMALLEGYSDLVMEVVGRSHLEGYDQLAAAFEGRFSQRSPLERLLFRLTGLEMKAQQYQKGDRFCRHVHREGGIDLLNRAFANSAALPSMAEIENPGRWVDRMRRQSRPGPT